MEVRIDSIDEKEIPAGDVFVSMRIGDMQKQSRFSNSRVFRFPESAEGKGPFGRVELFKRIGHATISLERLMAGNSQELKLPCSQDLVAMGQDHIGLRFTTNSKSAPAPAATPQPAGDDAADPKSKKSRAKARMDAAQKYLQEYRLEELLAETMREVISAKPTDPRRFIAEKILAEAPLSPVSAAAPPLPQATAPPKASAKLFDNFATYYTANFRTIPLENLYGKFGAKQAAPAVPPPQARKNTEDLPPPEAPAKEMPPPEAPVAPAADAKDAAIEGLRKEAASSLIRAAQDGTLQKVLGGSKAAAPPAEQAAGIDDLRKEAASSLIRAAQDGTLERALGAAKATSPPADKDQDSGVDKLRKEAASSLMRAAQDGTLEKALAGAKAQQPQAEGSFGTYYAANFSSLPLESLYAKFPPSPKANAGAIDDLKKQAAAALLRCAGDGTLKELLAKAAGDDGISQLRREAASSLLSAANDGTLVKVLTDTDVDIEQLRTTAASSLLRAAEDGTLEKVLAEATGTQAGEGSIEDLRKEAASSLLRAAEDGTLEKALSAAKSSAGEDDLDTLRKEAASSLLRAAQDGTLEKVLNQTKSGGAPGCKPKSLADQDAERAGRIVNTTLGGDFKMLPSVGAWMSSRPNKAPKAALKSGPAPAAAPPGLLPWADYYKANFRTVSPADYQGLYAMFSDKAAAPPAPPPPPPAVQLEAEVPAKAAAPAPAAPAPQADAVAFKMRASVGTWLMKPITFQPPGASGSQPGASTSEDHMGTVRQLARKALLEGAQSGKLREVLKEHAPPEKAPDSRLESLREEAREALLQGARSGALTEVLKEHAPPEKAPDSRLDSLRLEAREALLQGARSGALTEALKQHSGQEQLRQEARDALLEGARSGKLVEALKQANTLQDDIELLRQQAREALLQGAQSGQLLEALKRAPPVQDGIENLRLQARHALLSGAQSGKLREVLADKKQDTAGSKEERLKQQVREALLQGARSGSLQATLQQSAGDGVEQLRLQARAALLSGAQSGKLREVLQTKKQASAAPVAPGSGFKKLPSVGSWLMRQTVFLPGCQAAAPQAPAEAPAHRHHEHEALGKTAESVLSPESPMAHFVADLFHGEISADEIEIPDHAAAVELVTAFKAELDKKDDEIEQLKAKLMELDSV